LRSLSLDRLLDRRDPDAVLDPAIVFSDPDAVSGISDGWDSSLFRIACTLFLWAGNVGGGGIVGGFELNCRLLNTWRRISRSLFDKRLIFNRKYKGPFLSLGL
jgi:hypothetical protein